jgi:hypothetical protein
MTISVAAGEIDEQARTPPDVLYHYTSAAGLIGILTSKSLWASCIRYLNDTSEHQYTIGLFRDVILSRKSGSLRTWWPDIQAAVFKHSPLVFVASLSLVGDQLSQWRSYCTPHSGYAIGFRGASLKAATLSQNFTLLPCIYDLERQRRIVEAAIDKHDGIVETAIAAAEAGSDPHVAGAALGDFVGEMTSWATIFKHQAFLQEVEWRLVSGYVPVGDAQIKYRPRESLMVPYVTFDLSFVDSATLLHEIIVGRTPHPEEGILAVESLARSTGYRIGIPRLSECPYRSW